MSQFQSMLHRNKSKNLFRLLIGIKISNVEIEIKIKIPITFDRKSVPNSDEINFGGNPTLHYLHNSTLSTEIKDTPVPTQFRLPNFS
jgi:hypothetical protein